MLRTFGFILNVPESAPGLGSEASACTDPSGAGAGAGAGTGTSTSQATRMRLGHKIEPDLRLSLSHEGGGGARTAPYSLRVPRGSPRAILGVTILAWGNSIGDFFANRAVTRDG